MDIKKRVFLRFKLDLFLKSMLNKYEIFHIITHEKANTKKINWDGEWNLKEHHKPVIPCTNSTKKLMHLHILIIFITNL